VGAVLPRLHAGVEAVVLGFAVLGLLGQREKLVLYAVEHPGEGLHDAIERERAAIVEDARAFLGREARAGARTRVEGYDVAR